MWKLVVPAACVLGAEALVRRKINALPAECFPLRLSAGIQLRRMHNRGLLGSRLSDRPRLAVAVQTLACALLAGAAGYTAASRAHAAVQIGLGLVLGGALGNLLERYIKKEVTDYVYLNRAKLPFLRRIVWNLADGSIVLGGAVAAVGLLCG